MKNIIALTLALFVTTTVHAKDNPETKEKSKKIADAVTAFAALAENSSEYKVKPTNNLKAR